MLMGLVKGNTAIEAGSTVESGRGNIRLSIVLISIADDEERRDDTFSGVSKRN